MIIDRYERPVDWDAPKSLRATDICSNHTRSARRRARRIAQLSRPLARRAKRWPAAESKKKIKKAYLELIGIARTSLAQAQQVYPFLQDCADALA
jgi:hypothetical protein